MGTHEIFYQDIVNFYNKLNNKGVDVELNVGEEMSHVYPIYPLVPESKEAFKKIVEIIVSKWHCFSHYYFFFKGSKISFY